MTMFQMFRSRSPMTQHDGVQLAMAYRHCLKAPLAMVDAFPEPAQNLADKSGTEEFAFMVTDGAQKPRALHLRLVKG